MTHFQQLDKIQFDYLKSCDNKVFFSHVDDGDYKVGDTVYFQCGREEFFLEISEIFISLPALRKGYCLLSLTGAHLAN